MSARPCSEIRPLLSEHLDGELAGRLAADVAAHLEECPACRSQLELLRRTVGALRQIPDLPAPAAILARIRERRRPAPWHQRLTGGRSWLLGVPVGALATVLVVIGVALFQDRFPELPRSAQAPAPPGGRVGTEQPAPPAPSLPSASSALPDHSPPPAAPAPVAVPPAPAFRQRPVPTAVPVPMPFAQTKQKDAAEPTPPPAQAETSGTAVVQDQANRNEEAPSPPSRFVIPEPLPEAERPVATSRRSGSDLGRAEVRPGEALAPVGALDALDARPPAAAGGAKALQPVAGGVVEAQRQPPRSALAKEDARGAAIPPSASESRRRRDQDERAASLALMLSPKDDLEDVKRLIRGEEGLILETREIDPKGATGARAREPQISLPEVTRAWELTVRIPRESVPTLIEALGRRPGLMIVERSGIPAAPGPIPELLELRVFVLK